MEEKKRVFVAVQIKPDNSFLAFYDELRAQLENERIKWVNPENFHLTLEFIGEVESDDIQIITEKIRKEVDMRPSFTISVEGLGFFGRKYAPRVIWAGIRYVELFKELSLNLKNKLNPDFKPEENDFNPHLTLGRIKKIKDTINFLQLIDSHKERYFFGRRINEVILYESVLQKEGAVYKAIEKYPLK